MPEVIYQSTSGYLTMTEAAEKLGLHRARFRVIAKDLRKYFDPKDQRVVLVRVDDVERLRERLQIRVID